LCAAFAADDWFGDANEVIFSVMAIDFTSSALPGVDHLPRGKKMILDSLAVRYAHQVEGVIKLVTPLWCHSPAPTQVETLRGRFRCYTLLASIANRL
jgi:hypothetical protein